jgi:branched-subunit amino acid aminotransferase/4-amino-4-deoxychorismate lyase
MRKDEMYPGAVLRVGVNGRRVESPPEGSARIGHFTAMQVRGKATRGLELHIHRLEEANREMFRIGLDHDRVRMLVRHGLDGIENASVRVYVETLEGETDPATVVTVKEPGDVPSPQRLRSVDYIRPTPHLKHLATQQGAYTRAVRAEGFDDALLTTGHDFIAEASTANVGFFDGSEIVWPEAPLLRGITMQLLDERLGGRAAHRPVHVRDIPAYDGAFVCNARGVAGVSEINELVLPVTHTRVAELRDLYDGIPWDPI